MSDSIADRVSEILEGAERGSDDLGALDGEDLPGELEESGLLETAEDANDLVEDEDAGELLAALGLDELEDGTEPDSLLEAIAQGREEQVSDLRVLVKLAKIAEADDEDLSTEVGELREAVEERIDVLGEDEANDESTETDEEDEAEESLAESAAEAVQDAVGGEEGDTEDEKGFIEEGIESAMRSRLDGFGEELDEARARLDSLREDDEADAEDAEDEADAEDAKADENEKKKEDAPLGSGSRSRSRGTMHSTMAPSPSKRADMRAPTRHSTMPDR